MLSEHMSSEMKHSSQKQSTMARVAAALEGADQLSGKNSKVWYRKDAKTWLIATLKEALTDSKCNIQLSNGEILVANAKDLVPANPEILEGTQDLTNLSYLNEPSILWNLEFRYLENQIYTFAGPVLIALNPCKLLPLYTQELASKYKIGARDAVNNLEPHIYLVAANAFRQMMREGLSQSLLVTGESGAGKTETTKKAMQYFATLAGGTGVEDQVLQTNPILEAFGNAKTLRNHNSSRFGKLIQIHFDHAHHICGARIKTYLLEKSRVVHQLRGERSYHVFYQLVRGSTADERAQLRLLPNPENYAYLAQSGCVNIDGVNDVVEFEGLRSALEDMGVTRAEQMQLFELISGVLWLGNLQFLEDHTNDTASLVADEARDAVCALLQVSPDRLDFALTRQTLVLPTYSLVKNLTREQALVARDSLAKAIYASIFTWLVERINHTLDHTAKAEPIQISILDIYGFEQFETNSLEQLCINYANERLQQQFTRHLLKLEQEEYEREGIDFTRVEFIDNQECLDAIEMMPPRGVGLLAVLDEQCKLPRTTDTTFAASLRDALRPHPSFSTSDLKPLDFSLLHYAGHVEYNCQGFLDKNRDSLSSDLLDLMTESKHTLLPSLGAALSDELKSKRKGQTVSQRFTSQLRDLTDTLDKTGLHFVRCIKPNAALLPDNFDQQLTLHQLRCAGVLDVCRIARAGYPTRYPHTMFIERYAQLLSDDELKTLSKDASEACRILLNLLHVEPDSYQIGRTKVFFRSGVLGQVEDRWAAVQESTVVLQSYWRSREPWHRYQQLRSAALVLQCSWRGRQEHTKFRELMRHKTAAQAIQSHWRRRRDACWLHTQVEAASVMQRMYRCVLAKRLRIVLAEEYARRLELSRLEQSKFDFLKSKYEVSTEQVEMLLVAWKTNGGTDDSVGPAVITLREQSDRQETAAVIAAVRNDNNMSVDDHLRSEETIELQRRQNKHLRMYLEIERSLKERYLLKNREQAKEYELKISILQDYIQKVRDTFGDAALPPLPPIVTDIVPATESLGTASLGPPVRMSSSRSMVREIARELETRGTNANGIVKSQSFARSKIVGSAPGTIIAPEQPPAASAASSEPLNIMPLLPEMMAHAVVLSLVAGKMAAAVGTGPATPPLQPSPRQVSSAPNPEPTHAADTLPPATVASAPVPKRKGRINPFANAAHIANAGGGPVSSAAVPEKNPPQATPVSTHAPELEAPADRKSAPKSSPNRPVSAAALAAAALAQEAQSGSPRTGPRVSPLVLPQVRSTTSSDMPVVGSSGSTLTVPSTPATLSAGGSAPKGSANASNAPSKGYVMKLEKEYDQVSTALDDDVAFIDETRRGVVVPTTDFDVNLELEKLKKKFLIWKQTFKTKLKTTEEILKKMDRLESRTSKVKRDAQDTGIERRDPSKAMSLITKIFKS